MIKLLFSFLYWAMRMLKVLDTAMKLVTSLKGKALENQSNSSAKKLPARNVPHVR